MLLLHDIRRAAVAALLAPSLLLAAACTPIFPRVDDRQDRVCVTNGFPAGTVKAVYQAWGIRVVPQIATAGCDLVFTFDDSLGVDEQGNTIRGLYENYAPAIGQPLIRVSPLRNLIPAFRDRIVQEIAEHEFGHAMGLGHDQELSGRMYAQYLYGQMISPAEHEAMAAARVRNTAPRNAIGVVSPLGGSNNTPARS